jgi:hypothetical protein
MIASKIRESRFCQYFMLSHIASLSGGIPPQAFRRLMSNLPDETRVGY